MRIAMVTFHTSPLGVPGNAKCGGMNVYVREVSHHLARCGARVHLFYGLDGPDPSVAPLAPGVTAVGIPARLRMSRPADVVRFASELTAWCRGRALRFDVVHSHYWLSGLACQQLRREGGVAGSWVHTYHTLAMLKGPSEGSDRQRASAEAAIARGADHVIVTSGHEAAAVSDAFGIEAGRMSTLPGGVDLERFAGSRRRRVARRHPRILYVGRTERIKGLQVLIRAMQRLREGGVDPARRARLIVVGGGGEGRDGLRARELDDLCARHHVADRVSFVGAQPHSVIAPIMLGADVVVVPSLYESFGLVAIEAMACGVPVIASRVGGLRENIRHRRSGLLVAPDDAAALSEALEEVLTRPELRGVLSRFAQEESARWDWRWIAPRLYEVYEQVRREDCVWGAGADEVCGR